MRRILLASVAATIFLAGCGGSGNAATGSFDDITVSDGDTPKVSVPEKFAVDETDTKVLTQGEGDVVHAGDTVQANYVAVNGRTGKQFDTSFASGTTPAVTLGASTTTAGIIKGLVGQKVGSRVLVAIAPDDGFGQDQAQYDLKTGDTMVFLFDIEGKFPEGKAKALPKSLPSLQLDDKGHPTGFKNTADMAKKQTRESIHVVNQGTGAAITSGQSVMANYVGQIYGSDKIFGETWSTGPQQPIVLSEGNVIACWTDLLIGQKIGSRVVLTCPADKAYGDQGREDASIKGGDTLIYVVDLLAAY
ncbi:FKBP-type peptidyl-prolyl cis-trans isomerase [Aeromicrobium wangtongii]|uniref:FKBP-type peptidyl-prolyl cis-trans isomerase n=1 Tax=Aeromicrobium wangtongii TaxID=2969247 RepID=UPI0020173816|nr:FKBP-type peptidyl-prolyl cis-trans isomerase [Aeromicrobium wangtongii]MCL3819232.1 FKBP-type peptidyl-prolyl cis-trans isomerase [Aeromicrobium wangtongii]